MTDTPFTIRNVTKYGVKAAVHFYTAKQVENQIVDHTELEHDDFIVKMSSYTIGWFVSDKLKPYTDKAVDTVADKIVTTREARKAKKSEKSEEK
jgi:hypothetical protein